MTAILAVLFMALSPALPDCRAAGPETEFVELFDKYEGREGCRTVRLGQAMLEMMMSDASDDHDMFSGIETIMSMVVPVHYAEFVEDVLDYIDDMRGFEILSSRSSGEGFGERSYFFDGLISDKRRNIFIMMNGTATSTTVIYIYGRFDLKSVTRLPKMVRNG